MRILSIQPRFNNTNKIQQNKNITQYKKNNHLNADQITFGGNKYSNKLLDACIDYLEECRFLSEAENLALKEAESVKNKTFQQINKKIKPILEHPDFLWKITPLKLKEPVSDIVLKGILKTGGDAKKQEIYWTQANNLICNAILENNTPKTLLQELNITETYIEKEEHKELLSQLKSAITEKIKAETEFHVNKTEIKSNFEFAREDIKRNAPSIIINEDNSTEQEDFIQKLAHRAIERNPKLKQIYSEFYKQYYNNPQNTIKKGKLKREAANYASLMIKKHIMNGDNINS